MDDAIIAALGADRTIDVTTTGRRSGRPSRIETWFYRAAGRYYLTGSPGKRDWYANLVDNPSFTFHLKQSVVADLDATAIPIEDESQRRQIMAEILADLGQPENLEGWVAGSPLAEIRFDGLPASSD